jgi:uncharacterized protein
LLDNKEDILQLVRADVWMMDVLMAAKSLKLSDWWVCAGFVRSKIWDTLHGFTERTPLVDVDVIYFDSSDKDEEIEKRLQIRLNEIMPYIPWSVKNQARMHVVNNIPPYLSSIDAISKFPETATALGLKLDDQDKLILAAPWGVEDVLQMTIKPTPYFLECNDRISIYEKRITQKNLKSKWSKTRVFHAESLLN